MSRRSARSLSAARRSAVAEVVQGVQRIVQGLDRFSRGSLRCFGVTGPQLWALGTLAARGEMTAGMLTREMFLHPSTVTGILDRLENRGLVRRRRAAEDRRQVLVLVTAAGRAALRRAPEPPRARLAHGLQWLGDDELLRLSDALRRLTRLMRLEENGHGRLAGRPRRDSE